MRDLIDRQAAIDAFYKFSSDGDFVDACEYVLRNVPSAESKQQWIPCSERLPEDGRCLVTRYDFVTNTCFLDILWYEKGVWWNRLYTGDFSVIAWMPLPEPYKEDEDG